MKIAFAFVFVTFLCIFNVTYGAEESEEKYTSKYDGIDLDAITDNRRLLESYLRCLLDDGPCTPEGEYLKKILAEAIATDCAKCSEKQKGGVKKFFKKVYNSDDKKYFEMLEAKYDKAMHFRNTHTEEELKD